MIFTSDSHISILLLNLVTPFSGANSSDNQATQNILEHILIPLNLVKVTEVYAALMQEDTPLQITYLGCTVQHDAELDVYDYTLSLGVSEDLHNMMLSYTKSA